VHNNLGILYCYLKEYKKALQEFEIVLRLDPHNKSVKDDIRNLKRILNEPIKR